MMVDYVMEIVKGIAELITILVILEMGLFLLMGLSVVVTQLLIG
tara:strand:- start:203 stop:334 length:132 start_codon:yes stop_codon:yes gene_type:complete